MTQRAPGRRALVTGGAGLIGSHLSDLLLREGYSVRVLDNLEPQTHRNGKPPWVPSEAEYLNADIRDREAVAAALGDADVVFHHAAYSGYMPEISKYVHVNSFGTDARDHSRREPAGQKSRRRRLLAGRLPRRCGELPEARTRLPGDPADRAARRRGLLRPLPEAWLRRTFGADCDGRGGPDGRRDRLRSLYPQPHVPDHEIKSSSTAAGYPSLFTAPLATSTNTLTASSSVRRRIISS
jgi:hypothetical protein